MKKKYLYIFCYAVEFVLFAKCPYELRSPRGISRCFLTCYLCLFLTQQPGFHCKLAMPWLSSRAFRPFLKTLPSSRHFLVSHLPHTDRTETTIAQPSCV